MANAPFKTDPVRTAITLAYQNRAMIADMVLPRVPVSSEEFKWTSYNKADRFNIPDTTIDRKGRLNQVEFGGTELASITADYGLEDVIPQKDIDAAVSVSFDPLGNATELLTELIMLEREQRVAGIVHNPATYDESLKETVGAADKWTASTSRPIDAITDALEMPFMRPNILVINSASLLALRRNEQVLQSYHGNVATEGMVPVAYLQDLLEMEILVGRARYNSANKGQSLTLTELWGGHAALLYKNPSAMPNKGLTFGLTAQFGGRIARSKRDDDIGLRGATVQQVGESVKELVLANDTAYFMEGVI